MYYSKIPREGDNTMNRFSGIVFRIWFFLHPYCRVEAYRADRIPAKGHALIVAKHQRYLDISVLTATTKRQIHYMAKKSLFKNRVVAWFLHATGAFPVDQNSPDRAALRTASQKLKDGEVLGIFAEGTRIEGDEVGELQPGFILAIKMSETNSQLIPVGICYLQNGKRLLVTVYYGKPFGLKECGGTNGEILKGVRKRMQDAQDLACFLANKT